MNTLNLALLALASLTLSSALASPMPSQQAYFKASNAGAGDEFGRSVAISGDTIVIGAQYESSNATGVNGNEINNSAFQSGAAYVFVRNGSNWIQQAYLKASNTGAGDQFGFSVAISRDTIVVGAYGEDSNATGVNGNQGNNNANSSGAAYVFVRDGTSWTQQAYLKASNAGGPSPGESEGDWFGFSVAVSGDTIVVGAHGEDSSATGVNGVQNNNSALGSGAAYVFVRNGTNWIQQAYLKASNTGGQASGESYGDAFGESVAVSGDTVVIGAGGEDSNTTGVNGNQGNNNAAGSGAAYVFVRNGTNWTQQAYLKASNTGAGDEFGLAVTISGDTVVVGANGEDSNATGVNGNQGDNGTLNSGAAYVFVRDGTNWIQQAYLKASYAGADDLFGYSVAVSGDTLVVGTPGDDSNATGINGNPSDNSAPDAGAAYVFVRDGTNWIQRAYLKASNTGGPLPGEFYGDDFGADHMVAVSGDTVVVGAHAEDSVSTGINYNQSDNSAMDSGAAYVYTGFRSSAPPQRARAGKIVAWGHGEFFELTNVPPGDDFVAIAAGRNSGHALALRSDGSLAGWGLNTGIEFFGSSAIVYGQATVPPGNDFKAIAAGVFHSLALRTDGTVAAWGANEIFGHGDITGQATVPAKLSNVVAIDAGDFHSIALRSDGSLVSWGADGDGSAMTNVPPGNGFVAIASGDQHNLALKSDGSIVVWGDNSERQVSDAPRGTGFVAIAGGVKYCLALKSDGTMVGWGEPGPMSTPRSGTNFVTISAGYGHSLALKSDGSMAGWGSNYGFDDPGCPACPYYGQAVPRPGTNFTAIVASSFFSLAIQVDPPVLDIAHVGNDVLASWSTNHIGYTLEAKSNLNSPLDWSVIPGTPLIVGKLYTVTNNAASASQFFRLRR